MIETLLTLFVGTAIVFFGMFFATNLVIRLSAKSTTYKMRKMYETPYERDQRILRNGKKRLPSSLNIIDLNTVEEGHPHEEQAVVKARWMLEDLND